MFQKNMKIVVIGSNVKCKAGPRVGSTGYIISTDTLQRTGHLQDVLLGVVQIIFVRYGFEKKTRFERKNVILAAPDLQYGANPNKAINKVILASKKTNLKNVILAAPAEEDLSNAHDFCAKVLCKCNSNSFITAMHYLELSKFGGPVGEEYGDINKLRKIVPKHVSDFSNLFNRCKKLIEIQQLIRSYYYLNNKAVIELFNVINFCEVLADKYYKRGRYKNPWKKYHGVGSQKVINNLFNIYEFNHLTRREDKQAQKSVQKMYIDLAKAVQNKGSLIVNKHQ